MNPQATDETLRQPLSPSPQGVVSGAVEREGCPLHYAIRGSGRPVLLIQGVGVHGAGWRPQVDGLADSFRCLEFDNRGMGRSQPSRPAARPLTVEQMAADALAILDDAGWESAHVVGHSLGGLVAQHLALTARQRVRSLALLCTFARGRVATRLTPFMIWVGARTRLGPARLRRRAFLRLVMPPAALRREDPDALAGRLAPLFGHDLADQPPVVMRQLSALKRYDASPRLAELAGLPALVVSAAHDPIAPPWAGRALAAGIPGARYVELSDASHGVTLQQPERVNALLREHFAGAEAVGENG